MATTVVNKHRDDFDVDISRASKWGNPFKISDKYTRENAVLKYRLWINIRPDLIISISSLKDKRIGCYCKPASCHGDVLAELADSKWIKNWFSNMLPLNTPFIYQGIEYKTSENFYQAMKLPKDRLDLRSEIAAMNPYKAKTQIRNRVKYAWRDSWSKEESVKVMEYILRVKFKEGTQWRSMLDLTEDWEIVEWNTWGDLFWGKDIKSRNGENNLGKILMKIRDQ